MFTAAGAMRYKTKEMYKVTKSPKQYQKTEQVSATVKAALQDIVKAVKPQSTCNKPAVTVAFIITTIAANNNTPLELNGVKACIHINGKKRTLSDGAIDWLIEATISKLRIAKLPLLPEVTKAYRLQLLHTVRQDFFNNRKPLPYGKTS